MSDGRLLRPDRAATNIDSNILAKAMARGDGTPEPGELQSTSVNMSGFEYAYVLAANTSTVTVELDELFTNLKRASQYVAFESNTSNSVFVVDGAHPLHLPASDRWSFSFVTLAPVLEGGWAFLGEAASKWVAVSNQRFANLKGGTEGGTIDVFGSPGETVQLAYSKPAGAKPIFFDCMIPGSGSTTATIPAGTCQH
mmetsp:Transcript_16556/g.48694  ORF Transcript_16556/g.48694 Transcript_16556/m.48694 type:complete len:197 (-) Transcript_16556:114-704(-)